MREIKFRVWIDNEFGKEMVDFDCDNYSIEYNLLLQYTGLKDKNGKEIYEGDIVRQLTWPHGPWQVKWQDDVTGFYPFACDPNCDYCMPYGEKFDSKDFEVVGNIYENPELLERENK